MLNNEKQNPGYWSVMPATVRYDKSLPANAKILFTEITALQQTKGYCWASNNYFASLYNVDPSAVSKWIKTLKDAGYIRIEYELNNNRKIFLTERILFYPDKKPDTTNTAATPQQADNQTQPQNRPAQKTPADDSAAGKTQEAGKTQDAGKTQEHPIDIFQDPIEIYQDPIEICQYPIEKNTNRILNININKTTTTTPEPTPENTMETSPEKIQVVDDFSQNLKKSQEIKTECIRLNPMLIFNQTFYKRAALFLSRNKLELNYIQWLYNYCNNQKPAKLSAYFFKIFFEPHLVELFFANNKKITPPQAQTILCPVCGLKHQPDKICPSCGLASNKRNNADAVNQHKIIYSWPPDKREQYERELKSLIDSRRSQNIPIETYFKNFNAVKKKFGLV
jgi:ribosomal protein L32